MGSKRLLVAATLAVAALGAGTSGALAGELKGPPGSLRPNDAPRFHSNSFCAYSGLNDLNPDQGQVTKPTQTPADGPPGAAGHGIPGTPFEMGCVGGSNPANPPS